MHMKFAQLLGIAAMGTGMIGCQSTPKRQAVPTAEPSGLKWVKIVAKGIE